jgi:hypothetical protein
MNDCINAKAKTRLTITTCQYLLDVHEVVVRNTIFITAILLQTTRVSHEVESCMHAKETHSFPCAHIGAALRAFSATLANGKT